MRLSTALLTFIAITASTHVDACCLTDWLYGRPGAYYAGYAANPQVATYYAGPYAANYPVGTTSVLRPSLNPAPVITNGPYQAQRPSYFDNPSVYSGLPVNGGLQSSYRVPLASAYRGPQVNAAYATGSYAANFPAAGINGTAPGAPLIVTTPSGAPTSALPSTQVAPLFAPTPPRRGLLSRFFGSRVGTDYATSYSRAPVTYYRPATTVDPVTGTTITVQQPCTSYEQYVQRSPYNSLQVAPSHPTGSANCATPTYGGAYSVAPTNPYGAGPYGATGSVAPVGALGSGNSSTIPIPSTSPIPSTPPGYGNSTTGNLSPLSGTPPGLSGAPRGSYQGTSPFGGSTPDLSPVDQPSLPNSSSRQPSGSYWDEEPGADTPSDKSNDTSTPNTDSQWNLQDPRDSTAMIRPSERVVSAQNSIESPFERQQVRGPSVEPIAAPEGYVSPYRRPELNTDWKTPSKGGFEAPPLPVKSKIDQVDYTQLPQLPRGRVREAVMVGVSTPSDRRSTPDVRIRRPAPIKRDTTWLPVER